MTSTRPAMSLDGVLEQFMMDDAQDAATLERYVRDYPDFALQLIDLSLLIATPDAEDDDRPMSATEQSRIDAAWITHKAAASASASSQNDDLLATLTGAKGKVMADRLGVKRQVITCFRERKVEPSTVPGSVIRQFAEELDVPMAHVIAALQGPSIAVTGRSHKADGKPGTDGKISFEQILIDAGMSEADRARLLAND